jgi:hypothetical protein
MFLITFPAELGADLELITKLPSEQLFSDFLTLAIDSINGKSLPTKVINKAAAQLGVESTIVENCIKGLGALLVTCAKKNASVIQFNNSLGEFGFTEAQTIELSNKYEEYTLLLRTTLHDQTKTGDHFESLEWRLDVEVSSRSCRNTFKPVYVLALTTNNQLEKSTKTELLECDYSILNKIHDELTIAVAESKTAHARRIQKYVK